MLDMLLVGGIWALPVIHSAATAGRRWDSQGSMGALLASTAKIVEFKYHITLAQVQCDLGASAFECRRFTVFVVVVKNGPDG